MMTVLKGIITNSTGVPLDGTLVIKLPSTATTDSTEPDTIYTTVAQIITVTAGALNINVPETETQQIAYRFEFFQPLATEPLFSTDAIMPFAGPVNLASLLETGMTNRNLDTGAVRIARLIANDPTLSQLIKQPATFTTVLEGQTAAVTKFMPKPFEGAILARSLTILGISGYELWDFQLGVLNSSGNEEILNPASTSTVTQNGRRRVYQSYDISRAAAVLGLFVRAVPGANAASLTATMSIAYSEIS